jgi:hypothetical protein
VQPTNYIDAPNGIGSFIWEKERLVGAELEHLGHPPWEIPVPIPNTEVKPRRADRTARESAWESRSSPT